MVCAESFFSAEAGTQLTPSGNLLLHFQEHLFRNDSFMIIFNVVLRHDACILDSFFLKIIHGMKLSITLDTLTARILKLSSDSQSRIEPVPFYSWWDATDRRADSAVAPVAHEISPDHRF